MMCSITESVTSSKIYIRVTSFAWMKHSLTFFKWVDMDHYRLKNGTRSRIRQMMTKEFTLVAINIEWLSFTDATGMSAGLRSSVTHISQSLSPTLMIPTPAFPRTKLIILKSESWPDLMSIGPCTHQVSIFVGAICVYLSKESSSIMFMGPVGTYPEKKHLRGN